MAGLELQRFGAPALLALHQFCTAIVNTTRVNRICKATPQALDGISVRRRSASTYWLGLAK